MEQTEKVRPIHGGLTISNLKGDTGYSVGTLGCFVTKVGDTSLNNFHLLTNWHVLGENGSKKGDPIFQPKSRHNEINVTEERKLGLEIAEISEDTPPENYITPNGTYYIDCGIAKVKTGFKKCFGRKKNNGIELEKEIIVDEHIIKITGGKNVTQEDIVNQYPYKVFKIGRRTGYTEGRIISVSQSVDVNASGVIAENCLTIIANDPNTKFAEPSDSGAIILNLQNQVVGLLFAGLEEKLDFQDPKTGATINAYPTYACHIGPVLKKLNVALVAPGSAGPENEIRFKRNIDIIQQGTQYLPFPEEQSRLQQFQNSFFSDTNGVQLFKVFEKFKQEVGDLINNNRQVTRVWYRHSGPNFVAHFVKNFNEPDHQIPQTIHGISLPQLLKAMWIVLGEHGTPGLKIAMDHYGSHIIGKTEGCTDLKLLLSKISQIQPIP